MFVTKLLDKPILLASSLVVGVALAAGGSLLLGVESDNPDQVANTAQEWRAPDLAFAPKATANPSATSSSAPTSSSEPAPPPKKPDPTTSSRKPTPKPTKPPAGGAAPADGSLTGQVLSLVNQERANAGCQPLSKDDRLTSAAQKHSDDMSAKGYFAHNSQDGRSPFQRMADAGFSGATMAENIAKGQTSPAAVMNSWMHSDGHKKNILNCTYTKLGVGLNKSGWYWVQNFGG